MQAALKNVFPPFSSIMRGEFAQRVDGFGTVVSGRAALYAFGACALLVVALGSGLTVFMTASWQLVLLWGFLVGLGTGSMALSLVATVTSRWFVARRGLVDGAKTRPFWLLAVGFFICGMSTNGLVQPHFIPAAHDHGLPVTTAAGLLAVVGVFVAFKAVHNLLVAPQVEASGMLIMGVIGLAANVIALLVLSGGRGHDGHGENLNMRAALLEVLNDALGSVGVIIAAAVVARTGWTRADAVASLLIAVLILPRAVTLLRSALAVLMDFTPRELDLAQVRSHMLGIDHVEEVHDLHAWTVASGMPVLTAHVVVRDECLRDGHTEEILDRLQSCVAEHFPVKIQHATLQLEPVSHLEHEAAYC